MANIKVGNYVKVGNFAGVVSRVSTYEDGTVLRLIALVELNDKRYVSDYYVFGFYAKDCTLLTDEQIALVKEIYKANNKKIIRRNQVKDI